MTMNEMTFEECIKRDGKLVYRTTGFSMYPMLYPNRDLVTIEKAPAHLKKYDVALYRRNGKYVLHRVIGEDEKGYICRGDNNFFKEYGIRQEDVVGLLTSFVRKGRPHSADEKAYRAYARLWNLIYPLRFLVSLLKRGVKKLLGRGAAKKKDR